MSLYSCEKELLNKDEIKAIPGEVILGIDGSCTSKQLFSFINAQSLSVRSAGSMSFYTEMPEDSVLPLNQQLESLVFISHFQISFDSEGEQVLLWLNFQELQNQAIQKQWLNFMARHEISQMDFPYNLLIEVEEGNEEMLIEEFQKENFVRFAEVNSLVRIVQ